MCRGVRRVLAGRRGTALARFSAALLDLATVLPEKALRRAARQAQAMRLVQHKEILEADGYRVIRVTKERAEWRPRQTLARIRAALDAES